MKSLKKNCCFTTSTIVELTAILYNIFTIDNYTNPIFENETLNEIKENRFLKEITISLPVKGLEFLEFLINFHSYNDLDKFEKHILSLEDIDFFYIFFGGNVDKKLIEKALLDDNYLNILYSKNSFIISNYLSLKMLFMDKNSFIKEFFNALKKLNSLKFKEYFKLQLSQLNYENSKIEKLLYNMTPLEVSEELMGKTFKNRGPYKEFIFIPSIFLSLKSIRYWDDKQLFIYSISNKPFTNKNITKILKTISDNTRFEILDLLSKNKSMIGKELSKELNVSTPTISHHIDELKEIGFINEERVKNSKYYSLNKKQINDFFNMLNEKFKNI